MQNVQAFHIKTLDPDHNLSDIGELIRRSFADVAAEFQLTPQNCPTNPAFLPDATLRDALCQRGVICMGLYTPDQMLVGFAALAPQAKHIYELTRLCTAPEFRHAGLGRMLLDAVTHTAREQGAKRIAIGIIDQNARLKAWYTQNGFREIRVREYARLPFQVCEMRLLL